LSLDDAKSRKKTMYMHTNTCTYIKDEKKRREREREIKERHMSVGIHVCIHKNEDFFLPN